jgi:hypothetical protein
MLFGLPPEPVVTVHVVLSLIGIASGFLVVFAMIANKPLGGMNTLFLVTTILTSITGFFFPLTPFGPAHVFGVLSLIALAVALKALHGGGLAGRWRGTYVVAAVVSLYLNVFVGVVQAFRKLPPLQGLAPTESETPFAIAQGLVLLLFIWLGYRAVKQFRA